MTPTHGGKRAKAGRPKGSGKGRQVKTSSISLTPEEWARLDAVRGELSRSRWVASKLKRLQNKPLKATQGKTWFYVVFFC